MNTALVLTLIAFIFVAFALLTGKVAPSVACGISIAFLWITGVVDETQVFENFISSNVIVMIGMMIVIAALLKTSILSHIASLVKGNSIRPILNPDCSDDCTFHPLPVHRRCDFHDYGASAADRVGISDRNFPDPPGASGICRSTGRTDGASDRWRCSHVSAEESDGGECRMSGAAGILGSVRDTHAGNHRSDGIHGDLGL